MNRVTFSVVAIMLLAAATTLPFVLMPVLAKRRRVQLSLTEQSPNCRDGQFHNQLPTPEIHRPENMLAAWWDFLVTKRENAPAAAVAAGEYRDLAGLPSGEDVMVWLGRSSWYPQLAVNVS